VGGMSESLEERVAKLEERMELLSQRTTLASDTAGDALHVAHLNAGLLSALRETQVEHGETLAEHTRTLGELKAGQAAIVGLLEELIRRDDDRRIEDEGVGE
jgi:hypothetical protein